MTSMEVVGLGLSLGLVLVTVVACEFLTSTVLSMKGPEHVRKPTSIRVMCVMI